MLSTLSASKADAGRQTTLSSSKADAGRQTVDDPVGQLLVQLNECSPDDPHRTQLRADAIKAYMPLASRMASKFAKRGEEHDDLYQVALIGLIKAVDRYDPQRGIPFASYAIPTIIGELKRHFRDRGWTMRVSRDLQELHLRITQATPALGQQLQRTPTAADIAEYLDVSEEDVLQGIQCAGAYAPRSLNDVVPGSEQVELGELIGDLDRQLELVPDRMALRELVARLPERQRRILKLRFMDNLTQSEIAAVVGVSQMHVSRILAQAFAQLRELLLADD